jgi:hypothetical protein
MMRKSQTGPVSEDGDPSSRLEWKPATKSAFEGDLDNVFQALDVALQDFEVLVLVYSRSFSREEVLEDRIFIVEHACRVRDDGPTELRLSCFELDSPIVSTLFLLL